MKPLAPFTLVLSTADDNLRSAWLTHFGGQPDVEVAWSEVQGATKDLNIDCDVVIDPAAPIEIAIEQTVVDYRTNGPVAGEARLFELIDRPARFFICPPQHGTDEITVGESVDTYFVARSAFRLVAFGRFDGGAHDGELVANQIARLALSGPDVTGSQSANDYASQVWAAYRHSILDCYEVPTR